MIRSATILTALFISSLSLILSACTTAPVPISRQSALDLAKINLPDTEFPSEQDKNRIEPTLRQEGFSWTAPRYSLGKHLVKGNALFWYDRNKNWHITRYTAKFYPGRYKINRYFVNSPRDVHKMGQTTTTSLATCLFTRPAFTFRHYGDVSMPTFVADGLLAGTVDLFISPISYLTCMFRDNMPKTIEDVEQKEDTHAEKKLREDLQKGNPIPTNSTTPAWVE